MLYISTFSFLSNICVHAFLALGVVDCMTATPIVRQMAQTAPLKWLIIGETFSLVVCLDADYVTATLSVF